MTKVKICGITSLEDAMAACEAGADALGFNFAPEAKKRNRFIEPEAARRIIEQLPPFVAGVAVCVNEEPRRIREYLEFVDWIQFHGEETPEQCREAGCRGIKALRVGPKFDPEAMRAYPTPAFLLDAHLPGERGGTGRTCDWAAAQRAVALGRPVLLAGGLTPENVAEAVKIVRPYGVDTASGVEAAPGKKDHDRIRAFVRNAKAQLSR